jgi:UDP-N-acetylmuramoyl-tripeptide--D-alanyl-D-alanine ligase
MLFRPSKPYSIHNKLQQIFISSMMDLISLLPRLSGAQLVGTLPSSVQRVHTDSRSLSKGDLFVALRGERFDAHHFLPKARQLGAVAAIAQYGLHDAALSGVEVPDSRQALGELAQLWRAQFDIPLIAVTGSNGKTTVTQMIACILRAAAGQDAVLATQGNLNNDIGVPLTVLGLCHTHQLAVVELGMNHPGEIAGLAAIAQPTVTVVNNAQREHQQFMKTVEAVAQENGAAITALKPSGIVVIPSDDTYSSLWRELAGERSVLSFSDTEQEADVHLRSQDSVMSSVHIHMPNGEITVQLQTVGKHNIRNALAAAACAHAAGISNAAIAEGLADFAPVKGRSRLLNLSHDDVSLLVVDDTYNANPDSVRAAIDVIDAMPAPRLLVLGDMGEVGEHSFAFHTEILEYAQAKGLEHILCTGAEMANASSRFTGQRSLQHISDINELIKSVHRMALQQGGSILVKGSRFMRMERVIQALTVDGQTLLASLEN